VTEKSKLIVRLPLTVAAKIGTKSNVTSPPRILAPVRLTEEPARLKPDALPREKLLKVSPPRVQANDESNVYGPPLSQAMGLAEADVAASTARKVTDKTLRVIVLTFDKLLETTSSR
jgi:hypothetical protein